MTVNREVKVCSSCGMIQGSKDVTEALWDTYHRIRDGRSSYEPLVYTGEWLQENVTDEEDHAAVMHSMEKDMANRGLCPKCGLPDLRGVTDDMIMSEEEAREMSEMWAEAASERRMGC